MADPLTAARLEELDGDHPELVAEVRRVQAVLLRLQEAVACHHGQKADDRCWMDDLLLYDAAGLPTHDARVGDKFEMLKNCARFVERRCDAGGWKSYAELEAENERLKTELSTAASDRDRFREALAAMGY